MQVALAWLLQRAPNILLIPGTSSRTHLAENIAAAELVLPADALRTLDNIATRAPLTRQEKWRERLPSSIFAWKNLNTAGTIDPTNGA
jgi:diketogulonate reductase-like aldo/keto reductase